MNRRELLISPSLAAGAAAVWSNLLVPMKAVAADVGPARIKTIENFTIQIPDSTADRARRAALGELNA